MSTAPARPRKLVTLAELPDALRAAGIDGKRVVLCAGEFEVLHVGPIRHLEKARRMGDVLVVAVTPDAELRRAGRASAVREELRAEAIASLEHVDFVAVGRAPTTEVIRLVRPALYVKGVEPSGERPDFADEQAAVRSVGGEVAFTDEIDPASALPSEEAPFSPSAMEWLESFSARFTAVDANALFDRARALRVLVLGEAIIDEYHYCQAIGKSAKEPTLVVRMLSEERFAGGILAVCNHVASFSSDVGLLTQIGHDGLHEAFIEARLPALVERRFLRRTRGGTIVKRRFVEKYFLTKLFEVYDFIDSPLDEAEDAALCGALEEMLPSYDVVVVFDFGHGMLSRRAIDLVCNRSRFLAVNTQSNAGNLGFNTISRYPRADYVCIAEHEIRLEARDRGGDVRDLVLDVSRRLGAPRVVVTRGSSGALCYGRDEGFFDVPALAGKVVDRVGAGDAFLSVTALCAAQHAPMELVGFLGNLAGAEAVATVGHRSSIRRGTLLRKVEALLR